MKVAHPIANICNGIRKSDSNILVHIKIVLNIYISQHTLTFLHMMPHFHLAHDLHVLSLSQSIW